MREGPARSATGARTGLRPPRNGFLLLKLHGFEQFVDNLMLGLTVRREGIGKVHPADSRQIGRGHDVSIVSHCARDVHGLAIGIKRGLEAHASVHAVVLQLDGNGERQLRLANIRRSDRGIQVGGRLAQHKIEAPQNGGFAGFIRTHQHEMPADVDSEIGDAAVVRNAQRGQSHGPPIP